jgi:hypothetical protein
MTTPNIPQILEVFDRLMKESVNWRIGTSYSKYASARDELIQSFVEKTGVDSNVFHNHMAMKLARESGLFD